MRRKGIDFKLARHLAWRHFNPETDIGQCHSRGYDADYFTRSPHRAYVVIVPTSRCLVDDDGYLTRESIDAAECLPFDGWSRTNMVYGHPWRRQTRGRRFWVWLSELTAEERAAWEDNAPEHIHWNEDKTDGQVPHWFPVYWTATTYWVEDNYVYTATRRTHEDPHR
jgi:hypothetical protein